ncbi:MFS transporter [Wolbachia endosymbiont of Ctenocephalides felis wCfeJ]|uniref:MFS transporter n=1 Tax=Wolbachia endosymbiont of Ctenocephalides felis wCfeJ TaxID=2732594 RepID=UPI0014453F1F|nr:MFS transporter [Wolbachia endosymbiont of Ctenocephalides felis wCfeJ]WCR58085.1 MAG: putative glucarate transporter [Wolbachia endosymbiont of Ctenocephalides felis wCfeJ]
MLTSKHKYLPFFMWFLPLSFFAYQFILRLWPGLMMHQIMEQFAIDTGHFGILAAFYYYGYSGMQIPVAILLDRFGARYIVFVSATFCGIATLMFTYTNSFYLAALSRFLIGACSAAGFLGVSKVVSEWFSRDRYAKMIGLSFTLGLMGAIYGGKPIGLLVENHEWQSVALTLGVLSITIGFIAYLALRSPQNTRDVNSNEQFKIGSLKSVLTSRLIWYLALSNFLMVGSLEGFADVWGISYLTTAYNLSKGNAAGIISFIFCGMLFGGPLLAWLSKRQGSYTVIVMCGFGMALAFTLLLMSKTYNALALSCLFFLVGIMCCYQAIVFVAGSELVAVKDLGITIAFLNSINMLGGSFFHTLIGKVLDLSWSGTFSKEGVMLYDLYAYQYALSAIPICACLGAVIVLVTSVRAKKTNQQIVDLIQKK